MRKTKTNVDIVLQDCWTFSPLIPFNLLRGGLNSSALKLGNVSLGVDSKSGREDLNLETRS